MMLEIYRLYGWYGARRKLLYNSKGRRGPLSFYRLLQDVMALKGTTKYEIETPTSTYYINTGKINAVAFKEIPK